MPLQIHESKVEGGFVVLEPVGRLESKTSPDLDKKVVALLAAGERRFVVDLGATDYVSSAGLRVLLMLAKKLAGGGGRLVLCGLNPQVRDVFEIAGLGALFAIHPTRAAALAAAEAGPAQSVDRSRAVQPPARPSEPAPAGEEKSPAPESAPPASGDDPYLARLLAVLGPAGAASGATAADPALIERVAAVLLGSAPR
ncbi:MAG TPA: STAS domain-containing protein [Thermoanaerobaculia bacterium]|nr:STAS domain-containing protein [Thermoanaerobaculia bacterium]